MGLTVSNNADGSLTVSAGSETITVGAPNITAAPVSGGTSKWPPITPSGGGTTASFMANRTQPVSIETHRVQSEAQIAAILNQAHAMTAHGPALLLRFEWSAGIPLDMKRISEVWASFGEQERLHCEIHFMDPDG